MSFIDIHMQVFRIIILNIFGVFFLHKIKSWRLRFENYENHAHFKLTSYIHQEGNYLALRLIDMHLPDYENQFHA